MPLEDFTNFIKHRLKKQKYFVKTCCIIVVSCTISFFVINSDTPDFRIFFYGLLLSVLRRATCIVRQQKGFKLFLKLLQPPESF